MLLDSNCKMLAKNLKMLYNMLYNHQSRKRQNHTAACSVFIDTGKPAAAYWVALGGAHLPDAPALAVLLLDGEAQGLKPLLTGCHA